MERPPSITSSNRSTADPGGKKPSKAQAKAQSAAQKAKQPKHNGNRRLSRGIARPF